jgi:glycosyltransferase involved in cell wall biosynthesis
LTLPDLNESPLLSVVVPVFNEEAVLQTLRERLNSTLTTIDGTYELVFVDDGSSDSSAEILIEWTHTDENVVLVQLSRNFGMEIAMSAGIDHAIGDYVVLMHADLQDPPELIPEMLEAATNGADVVYARRIGRDESALKRMLATVFYELMNRIARVPYQGQAGDFRLMSRRVVNTMRRMPERRRFLRGMVAWVGFEQVPIEYRRADRAAGRGASYPQLFRLAFEAVVSFSDVPLKLSTYLGILVAAVSSVGAVVILLLTAFGVVSFGWSVWILVSVLFIGGVQLLTIGILGRYLARIHEEALQRPLYLVDRIVSGRARSEMSESPQTR